MQFRIANTFNESLSKLTERERSRVKETVFDLQVNPAQPGHQLHRVEAARDPGFWSVRVNLDVRIIVHRSADNFLLCYVDHHDEAYRWAERRRIETHPTTGAAQIVELRETTREVPVFTHGAVSSQPEPKPALLAGRSDAELLEYGVPSDWLETVRGADEDSLLELVEHLPAEAMESLVQLATGGIVQRPEVVPAGTDPFDHPDARRRFRVVSDVEELERALEYPWEQWAIFLHPAQRAIVERHFSGPARVSGSAGTGKTVVALHRAVHLALQEEYARVLLTTFSDPLALLLHNKLRVLISHEPRLGERVEVRSLDAVADRLYRANFGQITVASRESVSAAIRAAMSEHDMGSFTQQFVTQEWERVIDEWQLEDWESYRTIRRSGRGRQLNEGQRQQLWPVFEEVRERLQAQGLMTRAQMLGVLTNLYEGSDRRPFDYIVVDEAQDLTVPQLRFLAALGTTEPNRMFFAGDLGQRIFQKPFSWKTLGVDIRGRSQTLRINYRTSHQIRSQADRLLGPEIADMDGNSEERKGTVSVFNGPQPDIRTLSSVAEETAMLNEWIANLASEGLTPSEIAVFVRSEAELPRAIAGIEAAGLAHTILTEKMDAVEGAVAVSTMHQAKGLEYRAVAVVACDDNIIPSEARIDAIVEETELDEVYNTERYLLYVACTRARDHLLVTGVRPASEFLTDLGG